MTIDTIGASATGRPLERPGAGSIGATPAAPRPRSAVADASSPIALGAAPSLDQLSRAVQELNQSSQARSQGLEFSIDTDTRRTVVKVIDQSTKEVLRQIPTPEALEIAKALDARMLVTLFFFICGSVIATHHADWWFALPSLPATSIVKSLGVVPALLLSLAIFGVIAAVTVRLEKARHGQLEEGVTSEHQGLRRFLHGPWPLVWGAIGLALLNYATLALAGRPWGITSAFALWGAKAVSGLGVDVSSWGFWQVPSNAKALAAPVWEDITSVMDIGIILGALLAAGLAGRFAPSLKIPARSLVAAVIGGLLLGYGSRLAYGCNIGAYFSGIASGSLHGWVWLVAAFLGNSVGVRLRPFFFVGERPQVALSGC